MRDDKTTLLFVNKPGAFTGDPQEELANYGYEIMAAATKEQAIEAVDNTPDIDLLLVDIASDHGMDGIHTADALLNIRDLPIVFLFSPADAKILEKTDNLAPCGYVEKSSSIPVFDANIKMALKHFESKQEWQRECAARDQAEQALQESEETYRSLVENMNEIIYILNDKAEIEFLSPNFAEISGYSISDIIGKSFLEFVHPEDKHERIERFKKALAGAGETTEYRLIAKDGRTFWVRTSARPIIKQGRVAGVQGIINDITDRKLAEEEIRRQLSEKETMLKEVHHRIKNNIASVESLLELQIESVENPEATTVLQDAVALVQSMRVLYEKLLTSDDYEQSSVRNYIESLVDSVVKIFPKNQKISIEKRIDDFQLDSKSLFALGIIINELLSNTLQHAFKGRDSGLIRIVLDRVENHVTLTIHDNGNGLPEGFDITASQGFGLMLVTMLAQQFGGSFTLENQNGAKSTLRFDM